MTITVEIPDAMLPSLEQFILKYFGEQQFDSRTGALTIVPPFTVEQYILNQLTYLNERIAQEFPPTSAAAEIAQIQDAQQRLKSSLQVKVKE